MEEEEEKGSVSVSRGSSSAQLCEPPSGSGWDNTSGGV